jgi:hypothetical protein
VQAIEVLRGLTAEQHVEQIKRMLRSVPRTNIPATVVVDKDGSVGAKVYAAFLAEFQREKTRDDIPWRLKGIQSSDAARMHRNYKNVRSEMYHVLRDEIRAALVLSHPAIAKHLPRLEAELATIAAITESDERANITDKIDIRKALHGKSPDIADALAMCIYARKPIEQVRISPRHVSTQRNGVIDPYSVPDPFRLPPGKKKPFGY